MRTRHREESEYQVAKEEYNQLHVNKLPEALDATSEIEAGRSQRQNQPVDGVEEVEQFAKPENRQPLAEGQSQLLAEESLLEPQNERVVVPVAE